MAKKNKKQINIRLEEELFNFLIEYSKNNYKTVTGVIREMVADLYKTFQISLNKENKE